MRVAMQGGEGQENSGGAETNHERKVNQTKAPSVKNLLGKNKIQEEVLTSDIQKLKKEQTANADLGSECSLIVRTPVLS